VRISAPSTVRRRDRPRRQPSFSAKADTSVCRSTPVQLAVAAIRTSAFHERDRQLSVLADESYGDASIVTIAGG
jgi:hypothetical protein